MPKEFLVDQTRGDPIMAREIEKRSLEVVVGDVGGVRGWLLQELSCQKYVTLA
jgi:hypothetical protein